VFKNFAILFHFQQPLWLLALLPLALILWVIFRPSTLDSPWKQVIDPLLQPVLLTLPKGGNQRLPLWLLAIAWFIAVLALADPTWQKLPRPVYQSNHARVIVLDLSRSMNIADLKPSRLTRARFKINDILAHDEEGQIGLVVFAGDAFTVTPLTRDADTIRALLPSLTPDLMPSQGSRADLGLKKAGELLSQAGASHGQVILIADGVDRSDASRAKRTAAQLAQQGYSVSVLGVGTATGGPIPGVRDRQNKPIIVKLQQQALQAVASAGHGQYRDISPTDRDVQALLQSTQAMQRDQSAQKSGLQSQHWKPRGPLLILLLLPLAALAFRRGWLLSIGLVAIVTISTPEPVMASSSWDSLWQRPDQQADKALHQGAFKQAEKLAKDPLRLGSAAYKQGNYEKALKAFAKSDSADALYNKGNALARLNEFKRAIAAYDAALKKVPNLRDAQINKKRVQDLLKKQQQNNQKKNQQGKGNKKPKSGQSKPGQKQQGEQKKQGQKGQKQQSKGNSSQQQQKSQPGEQPSAQKKSSEKSGKSGSNPQQNKKGAQSSARLRQDKGKTEQHKQAQEPAKKKSRQNAEKHRNSKDRNQFSKANKALKKKAQQQNGLKKDNSKGAESRAAQKRPLEKRQPADKKTPPDTSKKSRKTANNKPRTRAEIEADNLSKEEKIAAQKWLRAIPDDPGGLLRRKFKYQYQQRAQRRGAGGSNPW
jgi:Ca-activated chloride channel family protein